jgi:hypothetical protein
MRVEKAIEKNDTPLARALRENFLTINDLWKQMRQMYYPCPQRYQIYLIVNGTKANTTVRTYIKILNALNSMILDKYDLHEIIDSEKIDQQDRL